MMVGLKIKPELVCTDGSKRIPTPGLVVLWDIDGTLMWSNGAGRAAMERAFVTQFGIHDALKGIELAGRTDEAILLDAMGRCSVEVQETMVSQFKTLYYSFLEVELNLSRRTPWVLPGVVTALQGIEADSRFISGLLTGNWRTSAYTKLGSVGLERWFSFGAFGGEAPSREALLPLALERAAQVSGEAIPPQRAVIVGDTPRDVAVGKAHDAKTIAVATGLHSSDELAATSPDLLLGDLSGHELQQSLRLWHAQS